MSRVGGRIVCACVSDEALALRGEIRRGVAGGCASHVNPFRELVGGQARLVRAVVRVHVELGDLEASLGERAGENSSLCASNSQ